MFVEASGQVAVARETGFERDRRDILLRMDELSLRMSQSLPDDVLRRRAAKGLPKGDQQMVRGDSGEAGQVCQGDALTKVVENEFS
jgi:hypothetical protein